MSFTKSVGVLRIFLLLLLGFSDTLHLFLISLPFRCAVNDLVVFVGFNVDVDVGVGVGHLKL